MRGILLRVFLRRSSLDWRIIEVKDKAKTRGAYRFI
jgi:hypothetical protein